MRCVILTFLVYNNEKQNWQENGSKRVRMWCVRNILIEEEKNNKKILKKLKDNKIVSKKRRVKREIEGEKSRKKVSV